MPDHVTIDNGVERDVDPDTDYLCPDCSTETLQVHHVDPDREAAPNRRPRFYWRHGSGAHSDRAYVYDHALDDDNGESGYVVAFMGPSKALNAYRAQRYTDHLNREAS